MYYQTESLSKDNAPTVCTIVDVKNEKYIVEYMKDGQFVTTELSPDDIKKLDYSEQDISQ
jgi:hypothetical protein